MNWHKNLKNIISSNTSWDKRWRKFITGREEKPEISLEGRIVRGLLWVTERAFYTFLVVSLTWIIATGIPLWGPGEEVIIPPEVPTTMTSDQAEEVIEETPIDTEPYDWGNNCLDIARDATRQLSWEGYEAYIIALDFDIGKIGHAIVGIPTVDEGWKYYEPQTGTWVYPRVGGFWKGNLIVGIYSARPDAFLWTPIEVMEQ